MPPLRPLSSLTAAAKIPSSHVTAATLLSPFLAAFQQTRASSVLSSLRDNRGAYNKRIRRGRGPASGKGKTSGRGHKGQGQHGKVPAGFNGGQTKDIIVHGVRGMESRGTVDLNPLNVSRLAKWISLGRIDPRQPITIRDLVSSGCLTEPKDGVKLLARQDATSTLTTPIRIVVNRASESAIKAIEAVGGSVVTRFYSATSLQRVMRGEVHPYYSLQSQPLPELETKLLAEGAEAEAESGHQILAGDEGSGQNMREEMAQYRYRLADATGRKDMEYYRDENRRGYLSHLVEEGQGPSLYFRTPTRKFTKGKKKAGSGKAGPSKVDNRLF